MKNKTSIKSHIIILLSIVLLAMLFVLVIQKHRLEHVNNMYNKDVINNVDSASISEKTNTQYKKTIALLKSKINDLQSKKVKNQNWDLDDMIEKYQVLDVDIENKKQQFRSKYEPLFDDLDLNDGDIQSILDLFISGELEKDYLIFSESLTEDDIESSVAAFDKYFLDILGEKNYEKLKLYKLTLKDRKMLNEFNKVLDEAEQLNKRQVDELSEIFYSIRRKYFPAPKYVLGESEIGGQEDVSASSPSHLPDQEKHKRMEKEYLEKAEELFSKEQFEIFQPYYNMNFIVTVYGGS